jgi:hypothetical protein
MILKARQGLAAYAGSLKHVRQAEPAPLAFRLKPRNDLPRRVMRSEHSSGLRFNRFSIRGCGIERFLPALLYFHRHLPTHHALGFALHHSTS